MDIQNQAKLAYKAKLAMLLNLDMEVTGIKTRWRFICRFGGIWYALKPSSPRTRWTPLLFPGHTLDGADSTI